jgi:hypothetical protein
MTDHCSKAELKGDVPVLSVVRDGDISDFVAE